MNVCLSLNLLACLYSSFWTLSSTLFFSFPAPSPAAPPTFHQGPISFLYRMRTMQASHLWFHKYWIDKFQGWCLIFIFTRSLGDFLNLLQSMVKSTPEEDEYAEGLRLLSSLISGKQRVDTGNWSHAFEMMREYLEVKAVTHRQALHDFSKISNILSS